MTQHSNFHKDNFPRLQLVIWPLIPFGVVALAAFAGSMGYQFNLHGSGMAIMFLIFVSAVAAFLISLSTLPKAIQRLKSKQRDKTVANYAATGFAIAFDLAFLGFVISMIFSIQT